MINLTIADLVTGPGVVAVAALVTSIISILKNVFPPIDARYSGALQAFVITGVLYILAAISLHPADINGYFQIFLFWLTALSSAIGIHSGTSHALKEAGIISDDPKPTRRRKKVISRDEKFDDK